MILQIGARLRNREALYPGAPERMNENYPAEVQKMEAISAPLGGVSVRYKMDGIPVQLDAKGVKKLAELLAAGAPGVMLTIVRRD